MLLQDKNAVIYGAGGGIGSAMARAFAADGARVFLTGRTREKLDALAGQIGDAAEVATFDATDKRAVDEHGDAVAAQGGLHVSVNVIAHPTKHGTPMVEMEPDEFFQPIEQAVRSNFLTTAAAARHMRRQGGGVILFFGGHGDPMRDYYLGGTQVAFEALESMRRQLSAELGRDGIRAVTLRSGGIPDSVPEFDGRDAIVEGIVGETMLGRAATCEDVGNAAVFAASDKGRMMTAATVNVSCGALVD
jgi:NAD(P)-dependent dehydrogenase (short-subunit alcohol dehydrogenase family)